eukprot:6186906-Pleurochrysis_carterae.AAC.1
MLQQSRAGIHQRGADSTFKCAPRSESRLCADFTTFLTKLPNGRVARCDLRKTSDGKHTQAKWKSCHACFQY